MRHPQLGPDQPSSAASFAIREDHEETVVEVHGEIDLAVAPQFATVVDEVLSSRQRLILDLSRTTFMDSTGLGVIAEAYRGLGSDPEAIVVRAPTPTVRRLLAMSGVDTFVTVVPTDADADADSSVA